MTSYVLAIPGQPVVYPLKQQALQAAYPTTLLPEGFAGLEELYVFPVLDSEAPAYDPLTQQLVEGGAELVEGEWRKTWTVEPYAPPPPPPPEPRWVQFGLSLGQDPAVNQFVAAASAAAPVLERMISGSLLQAAEGNLRTFLPAWKAAIDAGLVAPGLAQHLQAMAAAHDLPAEFVAGLNPPPEAP